MRIWRAWHVLHVLEVWSAKMSQHYDVDEEEHVYRICGEKGKPGDLSTTFGHIFNDEQGEQIFESLVGSLKAAKKRGVLDFPGQLLLMPTHKDTVVTLKKAYDAADYGK